MIHVELPLDDVEIRVLGSLIEKEHTTPDNYPLSLHALATACSQTSNRERVMALEEPIVAAAVDRLRRRSLVRAHVRSGARVTTYSHLVAETLGLVRHQLALLCVLMLRGAQTTGELRTRAQRLYPFADLDDVEAALDGLIAREPAPLVVRLPRRPGQKEVRYTHLLGGDAAAHVAVTAAVVEEDGAELARVAPAAGDRVATLEAAVAQLRQELAELRSEFAAFRRQFD
jgi:hypothetical protein